MERMSAQDSMFLHIEDATNPMHVGSVSIMEGPVPRYGDVVRLVMRKLHLVPRYRQRVRFVPLHLGRPVWADDPHFQVLYHVRHTAVPAPGGEDEVRNLAGRLLAQPLDRNKPLWEIWMVDGLAEGRWAVVCKTHHCMVDGVAGTDLLSLLFDHRPHPRPHTAVPWAPAREPGDLRLVADAWFDALGSAGQWLGDMVPKLRRPGHNAQQVLDMLSASAELLLKPRRVVRSLNGPVGPHRRWAWVKGSLSEAKEVSRALGGTVNDVVLAAVTHGFRELLVNRGEPVDGRVVRTLVPVSVRTESERGVLSNRVSGMIADLPVGIDPPARCLAEISHQMDALKRSKQAEAGSALVWLADFVPSISLLLAARVGVVTPQYLVQTVTTNVPGPRTPIYLAGRRMLDYYPYVPIGGWIRIGVAIISYAGELNVGLTGDYDTVPDLDVLRDGIRRGMAELLAAARRHAQRRPSAAPAPKRAGRGRSPARPARTDVPVAVEANGRRQVRRQKNDELQLQ